MWRHLAINVFGPIFIENGRFWTGKLAKTIKMDTRPSTICHYEIIFDFEHISLETMSNMFLYDFKWFWKLKKVPFWNVFDTNKIPLNPNSNPTSYKISKFSKILLIKNITNFWLSHKLWILNEIGYLWKNMWIFKRTVFRKYRHSIFFSKMTKIHRNANG